MFAFPRRALGFGFWWAWIYLAILSPALSQSPFAPQSIDGTVFSFLSIASGIIVFALAIPLARRHPDIIERRSAGIGAAAVTSLSTLGIAFGSLFGEASMAAFAVCSTISGIGVSVLYLQWGSCYSALEPEHVAPCTLISFLCALALAGLALDHGIATSLIAAFLPFATAFALPRHRPLAAVRHDALPAERARVDTQAGKRAASMLPLNVLALILVFCFAFGLFRVLLPPGESGAQNMILVIGCSAALAIVMLAIVSLCSISFGWDFIIYLALPLIALSALVLSIADFDDRVFVWAIIVAAVRCADLIMWMLFARLARTSSEPAAAIFAFGKLAAQSGVLLGLLAGAAAVRLLDIELVLLPLALALTLLVTLFGSLTAIKGNVTGRAPGANNAGRDDGQAQSVEQIARTCGLSPRETEIFALLAKGRTIPRIADELVLANSTVTTHARSIYRKMGIHNRQELIDYVEANARDNASER